MTHSEIAIIKGDGIGVDVTDATLREILAGAGYFADTGVDIEPGGEQYAGECDAIFLGAIGLPTIRHDNGTEISPHLRLRDIYGLYAGVRPVKALAPDRRHAGTPQGSYNYVNLTPQHLPRPISPGN